MTFSYKWCQNFAPGVTNKRQSAGAVGVPKLQKSVVQNWNLHGVKIIQLCPTWFDVAPAFCDAVAPSSCADVAPLMAPFGLEIVPLCFNYLAQPTQLFGRPCPYCPSPSSSPALRSFGGRPCPTAASLLAFWRTQFTKYWDHLCCIVRSFFFIYKQSTSCDQKKVIDFAHMSKEFNYEYCSLCNRLL